jgi:hypothetical protein
MTPAASGDPSPPSDLPSFSVDQLEQAFASAAATGIQARNVVVGGLAVQIRLAGAGVARMFGPAFSGLPPATGPSELIVHVWDGVAAEGAALGGLGVAPSVDGPTYLFPAHGLEQVAIPGSATHTAWRDGAPAVAWHHVTDAARLPAEECGSPLFRLLTRWLMARGQMLVHGAAVGSRDGVVLLAGRGGIGKSSTALSCLASGMGFLSDDYVALDPPTRVARPVYGVAKLYADQLDHHPTLAASVIDLPPRADGKVLVDVATAATGGLVHDASIRALLIPRVTGERQTTLVPLAPGAALRGLAPSTILQVGTSGSSLMSAMAELVRALPCHELRLGSDRAAIAAVVQGALDASMERV